MDPNEHYDDRQYNQPHDRYDEGAKYYAAPNDDDRMFAALIYVSSFFTAIICPLIIWMLKRDTSPFIDNTGKDYFNFMLSYTIWSVVAGLLIFVFIGIILLPIVGLLAFIFTIVGAVKAFDGEPYLPPLSIRFFK